MLTDAQVRKIKPLEKKTKYSDEKGMYLEVTPSGGMHWRMKFRFNGALLHKDLKCKAPLIELNLRRNLGKWST